MKTIKELEAKVKALKKDNYLNDLQIIDVNNARVDALKDVLKLIDEWKKAIILRLETARNTEQIRYKDYDLIEEFINEKTEELKFKIEG